MATTTTTDRYTPSQTRRILVGLAWLACVYFVAAYIVMPAGWRRYARKHPSLNAIPTITETGNKIPGDPLNVALIGSELDVKQILLAADWRPADPITLRSCLKIAGATVLNRPYEDAPVSNLFLYGRKQDLAFQKPVGNNPKKRHHVRFWLADKLAEDGRPIWVGSATFDERVGLSGTTGQITHRISADVDAERDLLLRDLADTGWLLERLEVPDFQAKRQGRNGGGDPWRTDGQLGAATIKPFE